MKRAPLRAVIGACLVLGAIEATAQAPPTSSLPTLVRLCPDGEPGRALRFTGVVYDYSGRPLENAAVVVHHTNAAGLYNPPNSPTRVPRLRGVSVTDAQGRYGFSTIWPGAYPDGNQPAHIHIEVAAPAHGRRDVEVWFEGDPKITPALRRNAEGNDHVAIVRPVVDASGTASFTLEIRLEGN